MLLSGAIFPTRIPCKGWSGFNLLLLLGFVPVNITQSIGSVTRADDIPGDPLNANQAAAHCDVGQAAISDSNDGLNSDDASDHASTSAFPVCGSESQLRDVNVLGDFDNGMY